MTLAIALSASGVQADEVYSTQLGTDERQLSIEVRGEIDFSDDFGAIERLKGGALLHIEERAEVHRRVEVRRGVDGAPEFTWFVNGRQEAWNANGRAWLTRILPDVFRNTPVAAEERSGRILEKEGALGLLREAAQIPNAAVQAIYLRQLLVPKHLNSKVINALPEYADRLDSDEQRADFLHKLAEAYPSSSDLPEGFFTLAEGLSSDNQLHSVLSASLRREVVSSAMAHRLLLASHRIDSDRLIADLLIELAGTLNIDTHLRSEYESAAGRISDESPQDRERALRALDDDG